MNTPTLENVLRSLISDRLSTVNVALPGVVASYDADTQRASVQPGIRHAFVNEDGERELVDLPVVNEVPVVFPSAGDFSLTFPVAAGDEVLLVFSSASLDLWLSRGGTVDPSNDRHHALSDAVAIPGLRHAALSGTAVDPTAMVLRGQTIKLGSNLAVDFLVKGTTYRTAEDTMLTLLAAAFTALAGQGAISGAAAANSAAAAAITTFQAAAATYLSTKVETE